MAAACFGNFYYHVLAGLVTLEQDNLDYFISHHANRLFYCLLLGLGIFASMTRQKAIRKAVIKVEGRFKMMHSIRRMVFVWTFYSLIHIWSVKGYLPFSVRAEFFLKLFGL